MKPLSCPMADWLTVGWRVPSDWTLGGRGGIWFPGMVAGESGPERDALVEAGDPTGEGEGPRMPGRWGDV